MCQAQAQAGEVGGLSADPTITWQQGGKFGVGGLRIRRSPLSCSAVGAQCCLSLAPVGQQCRGTGTPVPGDAVRDYSTQGWGHAGCLWGATIPTTPWCPGSGHLEGGPCSQRCLCAAVPRWVLAPCTELALSPRQVWGQWGDSGAPARAPPAPQHRGDAGHSKAGQGCPWGLMRAQTHVPVRPTHARVPPVLTIPPTHRAPSTSLHLRALINTINGNAMPSVCCAPTRGWR